MFSHVACATDPVHSRLAVAWLPLKHPASKHLTLRICIESALGQASVLTSLPALSPLGGSFVILMPFSSTLIGKVGLG